MVTRRLSRRFSSHRVNSRDHAARRLLFETLERRVLLVSDWTNQFGALDINRDDHISPIDVLVGINELNARAILGDTLQLPGRAGREHLPFYDVNGDGFLAPVDVLIVVNAINEGLVPPTIQVALLQDTAAGGTTNNDGLTANPDLVGELAGALSRVTKLTAQIDGGTRVDFGMEANGEFSYATPLPRDGSQDGPHTLRVTAFRNDVILSAREISLTLDTVGPSITVPVPGIVRRTFDSLQLGVTESQGISDSAFEPATYSLVVNGGPNDGQLVTLTAATAAGANSVRLQFQNMLADQAYRLAVNSSFTDVAGNPASGPTTFAFTVADPTGINEISPTNGEQFVNVTRETIVRFDEPVDPGSVSADSFKLIALGQELAGRIVVSSTERFATFFYDSPLPASTQVRVKIDGDLIMGRDGLPLDADGDNEPGGVATADFSTLTLTRIPETELFGYVYDAANIIPRERLPIAVPAGDAHFDPLSTGDKTIPFTRAVVIPGTGTSVNNPRQWPNQVTSFIDASMVYGSNETRARALRRLDGSGKLKSSEGDHLPRNDAATFPQGPLEMANEGPMPNSLLPIAGDVRAAEVPTLTSMHTLWMREHNRYADEVKAANPRWSDDQIYDAARRWVGALIQQITYQEFLPAILGPNALPTYAGYDANVDPRISALFSTAAFRMGHTLHSGSILRLDASGNSLPGGPLDIRNAFFNPNPLRNDGLDAYLRGMATGRAQEFDLQVIDDLRNFLFGPPGAGGLDLVSLNIQRGRDMGLPSYNQAREDRGLPRFSSFAEITSNATTAAALAATYGDVNKVDVWVGGLAEDHLPGGTVGPLFAAILRDQFQRSRDGDRFWYENGQFSDDDLSDIRGTTLSAVIARNSGVTGLPANVFTVGTINAGPAAGGSSGAATELRSFDGYGNNPTDTHLGEANWPLLTDFTLGFGDGIGTPGGADRPNPRAISNALAAQSGNTVNSAGLTDLAITWGQFLDHDLDLTPSQGARGTNIPVVGATIRVDAFPEANVVTDAHGFFELRDMPAPEFFVHIDGTTATAAPPGTMYPSVGKPFHTVPGKREQLNMAGVPFNVYLPPMAVADIQSLSNSQSTDVGFGVAGMDELEQMFPDVEADEWNKVQVTFAPGAAVDDQGTAATQAVVIPVPPSRLPAPLPPGVDPRLVISIQAPGATNFDIPAAITFPNLDNLPLGEHATLFSFNHDVGMFVPVGTMEVVDDGAGGTILVSDPGVGITAPGWHYVTDPLNWSGSGGPAEGNSPIHQENPPDIQVRLFVTGDQDTLTFTFQPPPGAGQRIGDHPVPGGEREPTREVEITVEGPFDRFYDNTGANGLRATNGQIVLKAGNAAITRTATLRDLTPLLTTNNAGKPFDQDVLYGAKITVKETLTLADGSTIGSTRIVVPYLLADQSDDKGEDKVLKFRNTVSDGTVTVRRAIDLETGGAAIPFFEFEGLAPGDYRDDVDGIVFDPTAVGDRSAQLRIRTTVNGQTVRSQNTAAIQGQGTDPTTIYLNQADYRTISTTHDGLTVNQANTQYGDLKTRVQARLDEIGGEIARALRLNDAATGVDPKVIVNWNFADNECVGPTGPPDAMGNPTFQARDCRQNADGTISFIDSNMNGNLDPAEFNDSNGNGMVDSDNDLGIASEVDFMTTEFATNLGTAANLAKFGKSQQVFLLDSYYNANASASFVIYSDNHLGFPFSAGDPTAPEVLGDTVQHEGGHTFGLVHSNNMGIAPAGGEDIMHHNAIQNLSITMATQYAYQMALNAGATVDDVFMHTLPAYLRGYMNRANPPHNPFPRVFSLDGADALLFTGPPPEGTTTVRNERFGDGLDYEPVGPLFALINADTEFVIYDSLDFGAVAADGAGGQSVTVSTVVRNVGDDDLVLEGLSFASGTSGFSATGFVPGTTLAPDGAVLLTLKFDPAAIGSLSDTLLIDTNTDDKFPADANGVMPIALVGLGRRTTPSLVFQIGDAGNNNCGGAAVGSTNDCGSDLIVTNDGAADLVFTPLVVAGNADFFLGAANGVAQTVAAGEMLRLPVTFHPSRLGLLPGSIRLTTNDPSRPTIDQGLVGTGLPVGGIGTGDFQWGNDYVRVRSSGVTHQARSNDTGFFQVGLATLAEYEVSIFEPVSGFLAMSTGTTGPSGAFSDITRTLAFDADTSPDTDFDGLPDNSELAIGSALNRRDSDGDGLSDFFEIQQGLDPLGSLRLPTGVVANLNLPGQANALAVANDLIFVATGFHGLAIVNGARFDNPILQGQLDLPGDARGIGVDLNLGIAAVATGQGLALVDVSDPMLPILLRTVPINAQRVLVHDGVAYAAVGGDVSVVDLNTGEVLQTLDLPLYYGGITGMARDGTLLFTHTEGFDTLRVIDISIHDAIRLVGEVVVPIASGDVGLHAGNGFVWLAGSGLNSVDVSDPANPVRVGQPSGAGFFSARRIALNGSGLGVLAPDFSNKIEVYDLSNPNVVDNKVLEFPLSGSALDVALSRGLAYVGNGNQLSVVNYLPFDNAGEPPTVMLSTPSPDEDPNRAGLQILEGTSIPIRVDAMDDVQIRQVELLINGAQVATDVSFPFDFSLIVPKLAADAPTSLVARAVDTGGNVTTSTPLLIDVVGDTFPPTVQLVTPADGSVRGELFRTVRVTFSESMDPTTLIADNIRLSSVAAPNDVLVPTNVQLRDRGRTVQFTYDSLPPGENQLVLRANALRDFSGNPVGAADITNRFTVLDATAVWLNPDGGNWSDAANWEGNQLPGMDDHVLINVPANVTITHDVGDTRIKSLTSNNKVTLAGGTLDVETFVEVRNTFTLMGGTLANATLTRRADLPGVVVAPNANVELDNIRLDNNLRVGNRAELTVSNGLTLNGLLTVFNEGNATDLVFNGTQTIAGTGQIVLAGTSNSNRSRIVTNVDETLTIGAGTTVQANVAGRIGTSGAIVNQGTIINNAPSGVTTIMGSGFDNQGTIDVQRATLGITAPVANLAAGTLSGGVWRVAGNATLDVASLDVVTLQANVIIDGTNAMLLNGALGNALAGLNTIGATGQLSLLNGKLQNATGDVTNNGQLTLGAGSRLNVGGGFTQADDATLTIGVGGPSTHGTVAITGAATLDGDLNLSIPAGVDVQLATLTPLTFGSRTGEFDAINGNPAGLPFQTEYRPLRVLLHFGAAFNQLTSLPLAATFNDGTLGQAALSRTNASGRAAVSTANQPRTGGRHLVLDTLPATTGLAANEVIFPIAIDAVTPVLLSYYHKSFDSTIDAMPAMFTGSIVCDGIALSVDGVTWHRVADLSTATSADYERFEFDLRAIAAAAGVALNDRLLLKFQQVGGYLASRTDGRAFDDIRVGADVEGPTLDSLTPAGPFVFAADVTELTALFSEPLAAATATNAANFVLVGDGNDNLFGTGDDRQVAVTLEFNGTTTVAIRTAEGMPLTDDSYRLTLRGSGTIIDAAGVPLNDGLDSVTFLTVFAPESPTNDTLATATATGLTAAGGAFNTLGAIGNHAAAGADLDLYSLAGGAGQFLRANAFKRQVPGATDPLDLRLRLLDSGGAELANANGANTDDAALSFRLPADGTYFVEVASAAGNLGLYNLALSLGGNVAPFPLIEDFQAGPPLASYWESSSTTTGRIRVIDTLTHPAGEFQLVADTNTPADPWLLVHQDTPGTNTALAELGLIENVDYTVATPGDFAFLTAVQLAAFDVIMVATPFTNFGLLHDEDSNMQSDLVEALAGAGSTGRAVLTTLDADTPGQPSGQEREFLRNSLNWLRAGQTTGLLALADPGFLWQWTPWAADLNTHMMNGLDDDVSIVPAALGHEVLTGLSSAGLSNWNPSYTQFVDADIPNFTTLAVDASDAIRRVALALDGASETLPTEDRRPSLHEAILHVDLNGVPNAELRFDAQVFDDNEDLTDIPAMFSGSVNATGVSLSADGTTWFSLFPEQGFLHEIRFHDDTLAVDLDEFAAAHILQFADDVRIKFQYFGFGPAPFRGVTLDNVQVVADEIGPTVDFVNPLNFARHTRPVAVAAGNLNADLTPDIVTANSGFGGAVSVFLNMPGGGPVISEHLPLLAARDVALGDMDGDTDLDLVAIVTEEGNITPRLTILYNDGAGAFGGQADFGLFPGAADLVLGDVNGDTLLDVVVANGGNGGNQSATLLLTDGAGGFLPPQFVNLPILPEAIALGRLDGDADLDLAVVGSNGQTSQLAFLLNVLDSGFGTFQLSSTTGVGGGAMDVALGDLNGDMKLDAVTAGFDFADQGSVSINFGDGMGSFGGGGARFGLGPQVQAVALGMLDADSDLDVVAITRGADGSSAATVMLNDGTGFFPMVQSFPTGGDSGSVALADINADSVPDVITASGDTTFQFTTEVGNISILNNAGGGVLTPGQPLTRDAIQFPQGFASVENFLIGFDEVGLLDPATLVDGANFRLVEAGADGQFDPPNDPAPDDRVVALNAPVVVTAPNGDQQVRLAIAAGELPLPAGKYRLAVNGTASIRDAEGNPLGDLDGDGTGSDSHHAFEILESGPVVDSQFPGFDAGLSIGALTLRFSEPIDPNTFTLNDITSFSAPGGPVTPTSVTVNGREATIQFPVQTVAGFYAFQVGPDIADLAGNLMNENFNAAFGEPAGDVSQRFFQVSLSQFDEDFFVYDWSAADATIRDGGRRPPNELETRFDAYDKAFLLTVGGANYTNLPAAPTVEDNEQTLVFSTVTLAGLDVHREVYVPEASGNFARLLDVLHNPTAAPIMVSVVLSGGLGGVSPVSVISTSSGDATLTAADTWFASDESGVQNFTPELAFVMQDGAGPVSVSDVELNTGMSAFHWTFNVTVGAGETVRLLSFAVQADSRAAAAAETADLVTLPARAKTHLSEAELISVVNFSSGGVPLRLAAPHGFATQSTSDLSNTSLADISANDLSRLLNAAVSFWVMAGLDGARADMLSKVEVRVADLPRDLLGVAFEHRILLDINGAGTGWHLDFDAIDGDLVPADRVDLLTALGHELGHLLGLEHSDAADDLMSDSLASGARHRPWSELVDELLSLP